MAGTGIVPELDLCKNIRSFVIWSTDVDPKAYAPVDEKGLIWHERELRRVS